VRPKLDADIAHRYSEILDYHNVDAPAAGMENGLAAPVAV
jgi:hypothetical protein